MKMIVEWDVVRRKTAEVEVPDDSDALQRHNEAAKVVHSRTTRPFQVVRGTTQWSTPEDGQFGGVVA